MSSAAFPTATPSDVGLSKDGLGRLSAAFDREIERKRLPGAVLFVARRGRIAFLESLGVRDPKGSTPMTSDAIFRIYSMTKPIVSVAAMMLLEEGRLLLADPIAKYLPDFAKPNVAIETHDAATGRVSVELVPAAREITLRAFKVAGTFSTVALLWSLWSSPSLSAWLDLIHRGIYGS